MLTKDQCYKEFERMGNSMNEGLISKATFDKIINPNIDGRTYRQRPSNKSALFLKFLILDYRLIENVCTSNFTSYITTNGLCKRLNEGLFVEDKKDYLSQDFINRQLKRYEELGFMERITYYKEVRIGLQEATSIKLYNILLTEKFYKYFEETLPDYKNMIPKNVGKIISTIRIDLNKHSNGTTISKDEEVEVEGKAIKTTTTNKKPLAKPIKEVSYKNTVTKEKKSYKDKCKKMLEDIDKMNEEDDSLSAQEWADTWNLPG